MNYKQELKSIYDEAREAGALRIALDVLETINFKEKETEKCNIAQSASTQTPDQG